MIYFVIAFFLAACAFAFDYLHKERGHNFFYILAWLLLVLLAGLRYKVGGDTYNYMYAHPFLPDFSHLFSYDNTVFNREPGWLFLTAVAKLFSEDFFVLQIILALIVNTTMFWYIKKHTRYYFTGVLVYYLFFYCYLNFEVLRESVALSIFMLGFGYLINRRLKAYYVFVIFALFFHVSAVILFFFPFFLRRLQTVNRGTLVAPIILFITGLILGQFVPGLLEKFAFSSMLQAKMNIYSDYSFTIYGLASTLLYYILVPLYFITKLKDNKDSQKYLPFLVLYIFIGASVSFFTIFFRFLNYIIPAYIIILTQYFHFIREKYWRSGAALRTVIVSFALIFFVFTNRYLARTKENPSIRWYSHWYPYYSIFDKQDDPSREKMYNYGL